VRASSFNSPCNKTCIPGRQDFSRSLRSLEWPQWPAPSRTRRERADRKPDAARTARKVERAVVGIGACRAGSAWSIMMVIRSPHPLSAANQLRCWTCAGDLPDVSTCLQHEVWLIFHTLITTRALHRCESSREERRRTEEAALKRSSKEAGSEGASSLE